MDLQTIKDYCLSKPGAVECYPFDDTTMVFKAGGKVFGYIGLERKPTSITLKCDPDTALVLRAQYPAVQPGYHTNKRHWNTVTLDSTIPDDELFEMVDMSYDLIVESLPKAERESLGWG